MATHPSNLIEIHARANASGSGNNRQPWMVTLLSDRGARHGLSRRLEELSRSHAAAMGRRVDVRRLKPSLATRRLMLPETEPELAMVVGASSIVKAAEARRSEVSLANVARHHEDHPEHWTLERHEPNYKRFRVRRRKIPERCVVVGDGDVRSYFDSLNMKVAARELAHLSGLGAAEIRPPLQLLAAIGDGCRWLPTGPSLSSVIGTFLLTPLDDLFADECGDDYLRWVDDITFGASAMDTAWDLLAQAQRGPLQKLGVTWHPVKTRVSPATIWHENAVSYIDLDDGSDLGADEDRLLHRPAVRRTIRDLERHIQDPEHRALVVARSLGSMLCDSRYAVGRIKKWAPHANVGDELVRSLAARASRSYSDNVAETFIDLSESELPFGRSGIATLTEIASTLKVPQRTRAAAAWYLARVAETSSKSILASLEGIRPYGARGLLGSAMRAGHKPSRTETALAVN